ncbi:2OG-Fe dioxygenase family protein [Streptomyces sp. ISL-66]|uniref:2OG-Fe dioxygenase family protein n=1 Tax=Streptomyces sp. ISL-66 TaxID=2819186 RepID=UPI001BE5E4B8|nr:2OG-Fe dioxygenase family protein [Streptomyces sp. ISL-66]MBT2467760.1 2OG-Fe dioxygenase family protein [Streptomyces sp. ISL-66]
MEETASKGRPLSGSEMPADGMNGLRHSGFARYGPTQLGIDPAGAAADDLAEITEGCADLPPDPYAPGTNRYRRYSHAVYLPWKDELSWIPGTPDPVHGTVTEYYPRRALPGIPEPLRTNPLLERLVRWDIGQTLWLEGFERRPMWVGVHLIKLGVESPGQVAVSLPNCLHQDGGSPRTFTFAHLISYRNITGGENVIATPDSAGLGPEDVHEMDIHARFTLRDPLDGYAVHDHRVSHYVAPVGLGHQPGPGERCILIVGLAPYVPQL